MVGVWGGILAVFCNSSTKLQDQKVSRDVVSVLIKKYFKTGRNGGKERRNGFVFVYES